MPSPNICRLLACVGTLSVAATLAQAQTVRVIVAEISVFAEPQAQSKVVATLPRGIFLEVAEDVGSGWIMVRMPGGKKLGFVSGKGVERVAPAATVAPAGTTRRVAASPPTLVRRDPRIAIALGWIYAPERVDFSESHKFTKYGEATGQMDIAYRHPSGAGVSADLQYIVRGGFGLQLGYSGVRRQGSFDLTARVPHPLYFQQERSIASQGDGLAWNESAIHVAAAYARRLGPVRTSVFAGLCFLSVEADLVEKLVFTHGYPFNTDDVKVTSTPSQPLSARATGPDFGLSIEAPLHRHVGLGALLRYSAARVSLRRPQPTNATDEDKDVTGPQVLRPASDTSVALDAGGLRVGVGLRVYF